MSQKIIFDYWLELINPSFTNNVGYKSDYCCDLIINQYDVTNELSYSVRIIDAFPDVSEPNGLRLEFRRLS
jgi:hypothetical protein